MVSIHYSTNKKYLWISPQLLGSAARVLEWGRTSEGRNGWLCRKQIHPSLNKGKGILFSAASARPALIALSGDFSAGMDFPFWKLQFHVQFYHMKYQSITCAFIFKPVSCVVKTGLDRYGVEMKAAKTQILIQTMPAPTVGSSLSFLSNLLMWHSFPVGICLKGRIQILIQQCIPSAFPMLLNSSVIPVSHSIALSA